MSDKGLKNNVPSSMRKVMENSDLIIPAVVAQHYDGDLNEMIEFIGGALEHQKRLRSVDDSGYSEPRTFKVIIDSVTIITKTSRDTGFVIGKKAEIRYRDAKRNTEPELLTTGWTEYYRSDINEFKAWQTSLANTIVAIAQENIGKECDLTKAYVRGVRTKYTDNGKVKFAANIEPSANYKSASKDAKSFPVSTLDYLIDVIKGYAKDTASVEKVIAKADLLNCVVASIEKDDEDGVFEAIDKNRRVEDEHADAFDDMLENKKTLTEAAAWLMSVNV